ncbi:hypothetical protein Rsub_02658 [Raphidocelis subcapitata]|uniref:Uncharacterized protein n=1 Tax=Raphidocelis subcapitata TaxID=307507 RepID=A0A2V0NQP2_9CHLO|nr:hypothetical protein Rsub_02658 [Raphidocelis subcapitata]|eukprot:GBF89954.1 hypothetical protein Rsub_02658 [Raphidocelis subcapitata]
MARYTFATALVVFAALAMTAQATPYFLNGGLKCKFFDYRQIRQEMFEANSLVSVADVNAMINNAKRVNYNFCLDCGGIRMQPMKDAAGAIIKLGNTNYKMCICKDGYGYSQKRVKGPNGTTIYRNKYGCSKCPTNDQFDGTSDTSKGPYYVSSQGKKPKGTLNNWCGTPCNCAAGVTGCIAT